MPVFPDIVESNDLRHNVGAKPGNTATYEVSPATKSASRSSTARPSSTANRDSSHIQGPRSRQGLRQLRRLVQGLRDGPLRQQPRQRRQLVLLQQRPYRVTVPEKTPPGECLVCAEHIGFHEAFKDRPSSTSSASSSRFPAPGRGHTRAACQDPEHLQGERT